MIEKNYTRTFSSFGGADIVFYFGDTFTNTIEDRVVGEISGISFVQDLETGAVRGSLTATYFDKEPFNPIKKTNIMMKFVNEYGQYAEQFLHEVEFLTFQAGYSIDMVVSEFNYTFEAKNFTFGRTGQIETIPGKPDLNYKIAYVRRNKDNHLGYTQDTIKIFMNDIKKAVASGEISDLSVLF